MTFTVLQPYLIESTKLRGTNYVGITLADWCKLIPSDQLIKKVSEVCFDHRVERIAFGIIIEVNKTFMPNMLSLADMVDNKVTDCVPIKTKVCKALYRETLIEIDSALAAQHEYYLEHVSTKMARDLLQYTLQSPNTVFVSRQTDTKMLIDSLEQEYILDLLKAPAKNKSDYELSQSLRFRTSQSAYLKGHSSI